MRAIFGAFAFLVTMFVLLFGMGWVILHPVDAEPCRESILRPDTWTGPHRCAHPAHHIVREDGIWRCVCRPGAPRPRAGI